MYDVSKYLTPHFQLFEFLHYGSKDGLNQPIYDNILKLAYALEELRAQLGNKRIRIYSGFRTPQHNHEVGGASDSQHLIGLAADIYVVDQLPSVTQKALVNWRGGLGSYKTWTHVDLGPKRRWVG